MSGFTEDRAIWLARHVLPHEAALRAWLRRWSPNEPDIDDVVQETYAELAALPSVADIQNPRSYAFQAARSIVLSRVRRSQVVSITSVERLDLLGVADDRPSPERQVSDRQELEELARAIAALPRLGRKALMLRMVEGLSQREVGKRLGITENAAQKHIAKSILALMTTFGRGGNAGAEASNPQTEEHSAHAGAADKPRD
jgi:RNA polymerase sigma-70 factor (ECF subfamily)